MRPILSIFLGQTAVHEWRGEEADKLRPCLSHFCSPCFPSLSLSLLFSPSSPNWRGVYTLRLFTVMFIMGIQYTSAVPYVWYVWKSKFEWLLKPVIVYLQCMLRDSRCYFSAMRWKVGGTVYVTPISKSGVRVPPVSPTVTPMLWGTRYFGLKTLRTQDHFGPKTLWTQKIRSEVSAEHL